MTEPTNPRESQPKSSAFDDSFGNERYSELHRNFDIRKRKTGALVQSGGPQDPENEPPSMMLSPSFSKRPNVKRKFVSDDTEERYGGIASAGDGDFHFSRTAPTRKRWESPTPVLDTSTFDGGAKLSESPKVTRQSTRKVLDLSKLAASPTSVMDPDYGCRKRQHRSDFFSKDISHVDTGHKIKRETESTIFVGGELSLVHKEADYDRTQCLTGII